MTAPTDPTGRSVRTSGSYSWLLAVAGVIALVVVAVAVYAVWFDDDEDTPNALAVGVTANDVADDTDEYLGEMVTVSGEITSVPNEQAIVIGGEGFFNNEDLLILNADPISVPVGAEADADEATLEGDIIQVTGEVTYFETDYFRETGEDEPLGGDLDTLLDDSQLVDYQGDPAIVAENISLTPRLSETAAEAFTVDDVIDGADALSGEALTLAGDVERVISDQAFTMSDTDQLDEVVADDTLLVIAPAGVLPENLVEDAVVSVDGTVREFDQDDPGALGDAYAELYDDDLVQVYDDRAIVVADSVTTQLGEEAVSFEDVVTSTAFLGETVTINGNVEDVVTAQAFSIVTTTDDSPVRDSEILVVGSQDVFPEPVVEEAFVVVSGTLQTFNEEVRRDVDVGVDLQDEMFDEYEDDLIITLDSLEIEK